jgi:hypothetical protein
MQSQAGKMYELCRDTQRVGVAIIDADSGQALPTAHITISSGLGIQEYTGSFRVPVSGGLQLEYRVSMPGYVD